MKRCIIEGHLLRLLIICLCVFEVGDAQQTHRKSAVSPVRGTLSGRVFAITKSGDLKPARIADIYIFFVSGVTRDGRAVDVGDTAGLMFMEAFNVAEEAYNKELADNPDWSERTACLKDLSTFHLAVLKVLDWAENNKKQSQILVTKTDEDGYFSAALPPGQYHVWARGRAGFNESLWDSSPEIIDIQPRSHIELKLASPRTSCLDTSD
ncbi:MAG TPA: hypothetical protein VN678_12500 [Acidobacteriaceae bacterium]|nr:hypothetical protein [Acidobacteriaceae bacterium]